MKLVVISHTRHYKDKAGTLVGWGPTISELNHLAPHFEKIYHVAPFHNETAPSSSLPYSQSNIFLVPIQSSGGRRIKDKINIIWQLPATLRIIADTLNKVDAFQLRTPTGIGLYLIPYLTLFCRKPGWYKYAGNWKQQSAPLGYALQRWMLKKQSRKVTINGKWVDQLKHCYTFENPCLTEADRHQGSTVIGRKNYLPPYTFCFVGRLEDAKGVQRILDAIKGLKNTTFIKEVHFIGDGPKAHIYEEQAHDIGLVAHFHGFLKRTDVFEVYKNSQFLLLPSDSEGFPKVVAEGMNFGCIPIVSDVSSIGHYVNSTNGYLIQPVSTIALQEILKDLSVSSSITLKEKAMQGYETTINFTFTHYNNRIFKDILEL